MVNTVSQHCCHISSQSCVLGKECDKHLRWFVGRYFKGADYKSDLFNNISISLSICSLIFIAALIAAIQINSLHNMAPMGPNDHNLMMQFSPPAVFSHHMPLIGVLPSAAAHTNLPQSLATTRFRGCRVVTFQTFAIDPRLFSVLTGYNFCWEFERRCDCFGDGAAAEAGFLQDVCVGGGERDSLHIDASNFQCEVKE